MATKDNNISNWKELIRNFMVLTFVEEERNVDTISSEQSVASYSEDVQQPTHCKIKDDSNLYIPNDVYTEINKLLQWPMNNLKKTILDHECLDITIKFMEETNKYWKCHECEILLLKYHKSVHQHDKNKNYDKISLKCYEESKNQRNHLMKEFDNHWYNIQTYACIPLNSLDFVIGELPSRAKELLEHVEETTENLFLLSEAILKSDVTKEKLLKQLTSLLNTVFPRLKIYPFGSRITGLAFASSDIDVLIDCEGDAYEYNECDKFPSLTYYMDITKKCLQNDKDIWDVQEILKKTKVPIIRLRHRQTGLQCDISFSNGLSVENTKLIKSINEACPSCRKLILFVKKWLSCCSLPGINCITNYALTWLVIFYLQIQKFLPSISTLIKRKNKSRRISGWETGVDHEILDVVVNKSFVQLLREFFIFYGHFNYRDYVICPLIGDTVQKKNFIDIFTLPDAMDLYIEYIQKSVNNESFRIDSSICIQDPYELSHNLTKAVAPITLRAFKQYCKLSANILDNM
uniref:Uncharacterized protein n=1 Tax=Vespula pensylvanica TaxID=30213 RepID=A0A834KRM7_VESPE|nr:hypothetical protein H0235_013768 [Vespula pensylvanica]